MILICTSDWHLDAVTEGLRRYSEVAGAARRIVRTCVESDDDVAFAFAGDLADPGTMRSHRAEALTVELALELQRHRVPSIWLTGNHDVVEDGSGDHTLMSVKAVADQAFEQPMTHVFDEPELRSIVTGCGARFNVLALPFTASSAGYNPDDFVRHQATLTQRLAPMVVLGHLNAEGISPGSETTDMPRGRDVFWPLDALRECFPKAVLVGGHYHRQQEFNGLHIVGSLARLTFGEQGNRPGYLEVDLGS